ncbi:MAG: cold-shock protein [Candidatus Zixiibacteriota bacterium]
MTKGKVKYFNDFKGWGFLTSDEVDEEVYFHHTAICMDGFRTLKEGQEVLYELAATENGPRAVNVVPAV